MTAKKHDSHDEHADGIVEDRNQAPPVYFNILFYGLIIWGIGFSAYYLLSGWSSEGEFTEKMAVHEATYVQPDATPTGTGQAAPTAAADTSAAALFASHCAACHGTGGSGGFATDLTGDYAHGKDTASIRVSITEGRGSMMPGFADSLSTDEIDALVIFLQEL